MNNKSTPILVIGLLIVLFLPGVCRSEILELPSMTNLENYIDDDTLVAFNLDNTVFECETCWGHAHWFNYNIKEAVQRGVDKDAAIQQFFPRYIKAQKNCKLKLVESCTNDVIKKLQQQGLHVMGLTQRQPCLALTTVKQLATFDIDFQRSAMSDTNMIIQGTCASKYIEGILFIGNNEDKGIVLKAFLSEVGVIPKKIVFIDDNLHCLTSVQAVFEPIGVKVKGLHYRVIEKRPNTWNPEIADLQESLYGRVLSDEEAQQLLR